MAPETEKITVSIRQMPLIIKTLHILSFFTTDNQFMNHKMTARRVKAGGITNRQFKPGLSDLSFIWPVPLQHFRYLYTQVIAELLIHENNSDCFLHYSLEHKYFWTDQLFNARSNARNCFPGMRHSNIFTGERTNLWWEAGAFTSVQ